MRNERAVVALKWTVQVRRGWGKGRWEREGYACGRCAIRWTLRVLSVFLVLGMVL